MQPERHTQPSLRLSDRICADLRQRIYAGTYRAGFRLIEADLSREFGVSRAPVREALATLKREGLVRVAPYRGAIVEQLDEQDLLEIQQLRIALEGLAARRVAQTIDRDTIEILDARLEGMTAAAQAGDAAALAEAHIAFHRAIAEASGLPRLVSILDQLARQSHALRSYATLAEEALSSVIHDHRTLTEALESGNPDVASAALLLHISARHEPIARLLETDEQAKAGPSLEGSSRPAL